jgi:ubiquitin-conjugating enzyme E2 J2
MAATEQCTRRLQKELKEVRRHPPQHITAAPDDGNLLLWYYVIAGPAGTVYAGGHYMGTIRFPPDYPFAPPTIMMRTPSGRFKPETRLCLSISDFHPKEWNPVWGVGTILMGLLSFMLEDTQTHGSMVTTDAVKREYAAKSRAFNAAQAPFARLFPELAVAAEATDGDAAAAAAVHSGTPARAVAAGSAGKMAAQPTSAVTWVTSYIRRLLWVLLTVALATGIAHSAVISKDR